MGHTNSTVNYNLPQFVGTDKPSWLGDVNGAFLAIDTAIAAAKTQADSAAGGVAGLQTTVSGHTTQIGTLTDTVTAQGGTLNSVTSLIGNGTPTTSDQTIIGAINEINDSGTNALGLTPGTSFISDTTKLMKRNGTVTVSGYFQVTGTVASSSTIANVPNAYRPAEGSTLLALRSDGSATIPVSLNADGTVVNNAEIGSGYYTLIGAYTR